jgi:hypothetical protein
MKVTIEKKETMEIEVQLPLFTKDKERYYKIEENKTTIICFWSNEVSVKITEFAMSYPCAYEQITEDEFNTIRNKAKQFI